MGWFCDLTTRKSQERTKEVYDYRVHLGEDQSVRSMKLSSGAHTARKQARRWVRGFYLGWNDKEQTGGTVKAGGQNSQLGDSQAGGEKPAVSSRGEH